MNAAFYSGHDLEWTQKFINALPKRKGLDYSKAVCIAEILQHKYTLEKKREIRLNHSLLKSFGVTDKNLKKYLPYFVKAGLIKWWQQKGASPKIVLCELPPNYVLTTNNNRINRIIEKGTSTTVGEVTSTTVSEVTSTTVSEVEKPSMVREQGEQRAKVRKEGKKGRYGRKVDEGGKEGREEEKVRQEVRL